MKFKNKIIISFCIIIFIPILLAVAVLFGFQKIQLKSIEQTYGVESDDYSYFSNSMQLLSRFTRESFETLLDLSKQDPDKLEDKAFLEQMNDTLREKYSYLVVRRGDELIYVGDDKEASLLTDLPAYGGEESGADTGIYVDGDKQALIKQIDFVYTDGSQGSVFIITILEETVPELKSLMADVVISIVLILILTACMLTVWIYTSFINPIKKLQVAAQNIKDGNLDFTVDVETNDEIGELCRNFEEMRQRLKDNAEEKLSGERENKALISNIAHD